MNAERLINLNEIFGRCLIRLEETVAEPPEDLRDIAGIVKHFELAYEQAYKCVSELLIASEIEATKRSAKVAFRRAFEHGWIQDEDAWISMIADRNTTAHTYDEPFAREMVDRIKADHLPRFRELQLALAEEILR